MAGPISRKLAVLLERQAVESRWESHRWILAGVVPDEAGGPRVVAEDERMLRRLFPGVEVSLYPDEAEGYFLNVSSGEPSVFVALREDGASGEPYPYQATLSYNEAARWMDGSEKVERAPAWPELTRWMGEWVAEHYRPEPKRRQRPRSFEGKEGRLREEGSE
ncbi:MAG TPA: DUF3305 domain-containing protein [Usitatibacter sp.]|nr:DUF3305 domain-containing protein [Usitatibacter sp.]